MGLAVLKLPPSYVQDRLRSKKLIGSLNETEGILRVEVNYLTYTVSIEYDEHRISLEKIRSLIS